MAFAVTRSLYSGHAKNDSHQGDSAQATHYVLSPVPGSAHYKPGPLCELSPLISSDEKNEDKIDSDQGNDSDDPTQLTWSGLWEMRSPLEPSRNAPPARQR